MSQHKRNVEGMQNAQRQKIESSRLRVKEVIEDMVTNKQTIAFNSIAIPIPPEDANYACCII